VGQEQRPEAAQGQKPDRRDAEDKEHRWPTRDYHSTEYAAFILNIINVYTLPNWDVNPEFELWFEVSEIDPRGK